MRPIRVGAGGPLSRFRRDRLRPDARASAAQARNVDRKPYALFGNRPSLQLLPSAIPGRGFFVMMPWHGLGYRGFDNTQAESDASEELDQSFGVRAWHVRDRGGFGACGNLKVFDVSNCAVAIVGAGLAGLCAARLLKAQDVDFMLIEARDRLGGRILTANHAGLPCEDGFDLGPSWYWPHLQPAIGALIEELGLGAFYQNSDGDVIFERMSRETPQRYRSLAQEQQSMRLVGGTAALVRALAQELPVEQVQLKTRVTAMAITRNGVELSLSRAGGEVETLTATQVIAALPPRLLEAMVMFTPAQDATTAKRWRDTPTWMAPHAKFFALYERPFWREAGLSGTVQSMVGPMVEMHDATTASGGAALFGFLGMAAEQRAAIGEETLTRACLSQFARIFGTEATHPRATLFKDWAADPFTATAADSVASGHAVPVDASWVSEPWRDHLALAGSETSPSDPGYLAGAVVAAKRAVAELKPFRSGRRFRVGSTRKSDSA